jgi:hypothetical protein
MMTQCTWHWNKPNKALNTDTRAYARFADLTEATLTDADLDLFRIKIWNMDSDTMIYDNGLGIDNDGDPITAIEGGSIVIHKAKK